MNKNKGILLSLVITAFIGIYTQNLYQHTFNEINITFGIVTMILVHLVDLLMVLTVVFSFLELIKRQKEDKTFYLMVSIFTTFFFFLQNYWLCEYILFYANTSLGATLFVILVPLFFLLASFVFAGIINGVVFSVLELNIERLSLINRYENINGIIRELNDNRSKIDQEIVQMLEHKILFFNQAMERYDHLNEKNRLEFQQEIEEMVKVLESALLEVKNEMDERDEKEKENLRESMKQFYTK